MPSSWNFDSAAPADSPYWPSISLACRCSRGRIVLDGHETKEGIGSAALFVVISSRKNARPNVGMTHPQQGGSHANATHPSPRNDRDRDCHADQKAICQGGATRDAGQLRPASWRMRLPHAYSRRSREIPVLSRARLYAGGGAARGNGGAAQEPSDPARG